MFCTCTNIRSTGNIYASDTNSLVGILTMKYVAQLVMKLFHDDRPTMKSIQNGACNFNIDHTPDHLYVHVAADTYS